MAYPISGDLRAPVEHIYRTVLKTALLNQTPPSLAPSPTMPRLGVKRVLPPYLGEMGYEVRLHLARIEPWLSNGWKILARRPDFYPSGTAIHSADFFAACDKIMADHGVVGSFGGIYIVPLEFGELTVTPQFEGEKGVIQVGLSDITKMFRQALVEIELRKLFLDWLDHDGRPVTEYDRDALSFQPTSKGNIDYRLAESLRPSYLPHAFEHPVEPAPSHVGFQMRAVNNGVVQYRNSDPAWMCATAQAIGAHLGLPVMAYGHQDGCVIPSEFQATWDPARGAEGHLARELGYLKSCRLMLSPDSGWADLMAWLGVPVLLEMLLSPIVFDSMRDSFQPRFALVDRTAPIGPQVDALLASGPCLPTTDPRKSGTAKAFFPWEP